MRRPMPRLFGLFLAVFCALALPSAAAAAPLTWSSAVNIDGANTLTSVSCPSAGLCVAMDAASPSNALVSTNPTGGAGTWTADPIGVISQSIAAVSCPSTTLCVAVDDAGFVYWSTDPAGSVWTDSGVSVNGGNGLRAISCPTTTLCVAAGLGGNIVWSTNPTGGAGTWTIANVDATNAPLSISCATTTFCVLGDDVGAVISSTDPTGGALQWSAPATVSAQVIRGMSCPSTSLCVAGDDDGNAITSTNPTGGALAWTGAFIAGVAFVNATECASTTLCIAADSGGKVFESVNPTGGVAAWGPTTLGTQVRDVGCASEILCAAVGNSGNAYFGTQALLSVSTGGTGSGSVSGGGIACPPSCSKAHPFGTSVTLDAAPAADSTFAGWSGDCTGTGQCTTTLSQSRSVVATFDPIPPAATPTVSDPPPPSAQLPPPVVAVSANAIPVLPGVLVKLPGTTKFVPLNSPSQIQFGAVIDARKGRVRLVIANGNGGTDSADFYQGVFKITQANTRPAIVTLTLVGGSFKRCPRVRSVRAAAVKKGKSVRHLWGDGSGAFRTKGRFASATIRGTRWVTDDRCNGTLVRVAVGAVTVRDLKKRKSLVLKAPKSYFAAP